MCLCRPEPEVMRVFSMTSRRTMKAMNRMELPYSGHNMGSVSINVFGQSSPLLSKRTAWRWRRIIDGPV